MQVLENLIIPLLILAAMVAVTIALAMYRYFVAKQQDFHIHVTAEDVPDVGKQNLVATKLNWIDHWGKTATVITLVYFLLLLMIILYREWQRSGSDVLVR